MRKEEQIFGFGRKPASLPSILVAVPEGPRPPRTPPAPVWVGVGVKPPEPEAEPGFWVGVPTPLLLLPAELHEKRRK